MGHIFQHRQVQQPGKAKAMEQLPSQHEEFAVNRSLWCLATPQPQIEATTMKKGSWNSEPISELQSKACPLTEQDLP